jgi:hypothetical protein
VNNKQTEEWLNYYKKHCTNQNYEGDNLFHTEDNVDVDPIEYEELGKYQVLLKTQNPHDMMAST